MKLVEQEQRALARERAWFEREKVAAVAAPSAGPVITEPAVAPEVSGVPDRKEVRQWPEDVYTFGEAAARLRCSYHTIWRGVARGKIKACKYQSGRIPAAEVERLVRGE